MSHINSLLMCSKVINNYKAYEPRGFSPEKYGFEMKLNISFHSDFISEK